MLVPCEIFITAVIAWYCLKNTDLFPQTSEKSCDWIKENYSGVQMLSKCWIFEENNLFKKQKAFAF